MASLEQLVAARVRQARKRADFPLEQLAQKIGVETTTLSRTNEA
jgi:transcriptional regulator with XRE-family HTH domain